MEKSNKLELVRTGRSENIFFHCIFAYSYLRFVIESKLSSPTCYVGKFFQLTIVHSDTLRRYIALVLPYKEQQL